MIDKEVLNDKAAEIIEDPESYNQYIKRLEVIREKKNKKKNEEKKFLEVVFYGIIKLKIIIII